MTCQWCQKPAEGLTPVLVEHSRSATREKRKIVTSPKILNVCPPCEKRLKNR